VLRWAQSILEDWDALQQEIAALRNTSGTLAGRLSVGVIPSALPMAALITKAIDERHPDVELVVLSQSSIEILRHLEEFSVDVGLTYLDNEPIEGMLAAFDCARAVQPPALSRPARGCSGVPR
jgi:DNA-binding transcriptional LysR family regulator